MGELYPFAYIITSVSPMNISFNHDKVTFGSTWSGFSTQIYWPACQLETKRNPETGDNENITGINVKLDTRFRIEFNELDHEYAIGVMVLGLGIGFQYLKPEQP